MPSDRRLSDREMFEAIYIEPQTHLFTDRAWAVLQQKAAKNWTLAINLSFLIDDAVSDAMTQELANEAVWLIGSALQRHGGEEVCASRPHADQLAACHDDKG